MENFILVIVFMITNLYIKKSNKETDLFFRIFRYPSVLPSFFINATHVWHCVKKIFFNFLLKLTVNVIRIRKKVCKIILKS